MDECSRDGILVILDVFPCRDVQTLASGARHVQPFCWRHVRILEAILKESKVAQAEKGRSHGCCVGIMWAKIGYVDAMFSEGEAEILLVRCHILQIVGFDFCDVKCCKCANGVEKGVVFKC